MLRHRMYCVVALLLVSATVFADGTASRPELRDLFFGEALFYARQNDYFSAITRLDTELKQYYAQDVPALDPLHFHQDEAEFTVGDMELLYRMHRRAGRALKAVMEGRVDETTRNEAAYRLARIYFQKGRSLDALHTIELIHGELPEAVRVDAAFLRAQIYLAAGRNAEAADLLEALQGEPGLAGFAAYNLGIAWIREGREAAGFAQLDKVGRMRSDDPAVQTLRDKANYTLGYHLVEGGAPQQALRYLERVRLDGPYSNKALLAAGWVDVSLGHYDQALVPWSLLHDRDETSAAVQEAILAVPFAYGKLELYGKAALSYGFAMEAFARESSRLNASIKSIRQGHLLTALLREEAKRDKFWLVNLRELPDAPETRYLLDLMASHDFQEALKNYYDLAELRRRVASASQDLPVYEELIEQRRRYYEPLLPAIDEKFRTLDAHIKLRVEQRARLAQRIESLLIARRPEYLESGAEHQARESLQRMEQYLVLHPELATERTRQRIDRLTGIIDWQVASRYDDRLTDAYTHVHELDAVIEELNRRYRSFVRSRQAATQSYQGYELPLRRLRTRLQAADRDLRDIMARQGRAIETLAIDELERRRARLDEYQIKARFALAESYDRATKAQQEERKQP